MGLIVLQLVPGVYQESSMMLFQLLLAWLLLALRVLYYFVKKKISVLSSVHAYYLSLIGKELKWNEILVII